MTWCPVANLQHVQAPKAHLHVRIWCWNPTLQCVHDDSPKSLRPGQVMIALARILKSAILRKRLYSYRWTSLSFAWRRMQWAQFKSNLKLHSWCTFSQKMSWGYKVRKRLSLRSLWSRLLQINGFSDACRVFAPCFGLWYYDNSLET